MTISAWDVYWVMQMDSIRGAMIVPIVLCGLAGVVVAIVSINACVVIDVWGCDSEKGKKAVATLMKVRRPAIFIAAIMLLCVLLRALTPSTTTLATAYILPEIANSETLREECSELYDIAKSGLRKMAGVDESEVTE